MIPLQKLRAVTRLITHANCPDGEATAAIIKDALPDVRVSRVKYGSEEHKALCPENGVIFCDFSPYLPKEGVTEHVGPLLHGTREMMVDLWRRAGTIVLDHHSRDVVEPYGELGVFGENEKLQCGAWLAYEHVWLPTYVDEGGAEGDSVASETEAFALRAAVRDTWQRDDERFKRAREEGELLLFWGMKQPLDYYLDLSDEGRGALAGRLFERAEELARKCIAESCRFTSARGTRVLMFQGVSATSDAAELLEKEYEPLQNKATTSDEKFLAPYLQAYRLQQPDLVVGFHYRHETCGGCGGGGDNDPSGAQGDDPLCPQCRGSGGRLMLQFSTRSHTGFDCQALARAHGGNGHKAAAGFTIEQSAEVGSNPYAVFRLLLEEWEDTQ